MKRFRQQFTNSSYHIKVKSPESLWFQAMDQKAWLFVVSWKKRALSAYQYNKFKVASGLNLLAPPRFAEQSKYSLLRQNAGLAWMGLLLFVCHCAGPFTATCSAGLPLMVCRRLFSMLNILWRCCTRLGDRPCACLCFWRYSISKHWYFGKNISDVFGKVKQRPLVSWQDIHLGKK